jgi:hypothetical protein
MLLRDSVHKTKSQTAAILQRADNAGFSPATVNFYAEFN